MLKMLKDTKSDSSTDILKWQGKTLPDYEDGQGPCWQVAPGEVAWAGRYPRDVHPAFPGWPPLAVRRARLNITTNLLILGSHFISPQIT